MIEISLIALCLTGAALVIIGYKLGHATGYNAGLARANEIMNEAWYGYGPEEDGE